MATPCISCTLWTLPKASNMVPLGPYLAPAWLRAHLTTKPAVCHFCFVPWASLTSGNSAISFFICLLSNHNTATLLLVWNLTSVSQTPAISARTSHLASSIDNNAGISHPIPAWCLQLAMAIPLNCIQHATNLGSRLPPQSRRRRRVIRLMCFNEIHFHIAILQFFESNGRTRASPASTR